MKTLYIIGNGFDLAHGLKTRYQHFALFLKRNNPELFDLMVKYYWLTDLDEEDEEESLKDESWGDFENRLSELDFEALLEDFLDYIVPIGSEEFKDRDNHVYDQQVSALIDRLTKELYGEFKDFILQVEFASEPKGLINLEEDSGFLSFNYTDTLENYYGVPRKKITYIHGRAKTEGEKTILGHGIDPEEFEDKPAVAPAGLTEEQHFDWMQEQNDGYDYAYNQGRDTAIGYFRTSHKSTAEIIADNGPFFYSISSVEKIYVLGHSLSAVDLPYFEEIIQINPEATWVISCRNEEDKPEIIEKLEQLGVKKENINFTTIDELRPANPELF